MINLFFQGVYLLIYFLSMITKQVTNPIRLFADFECTNTTHDETKNNENLSSDKNQLQ